jgi:hypothetical protein
VATEPPEEDEMKRSSAVVVALVAVACWAVSTQAAWISGTKWNIDTRMFADIDSADDFEMYIGGALKDDIIDEDRGGWPGWAAVDLPGGGCKVHWSGRSVGPGERTHQGVAVDPAAKGAYVYEITWTLGGEIVGGLEFLDFWQGGGASCAVGHRLEIPSSSLTSDGDSLYIKRSWARTTYRFSLDSMVPGNNQLEGLAWTTIDAESIPVAPGESAKYEVQTVAGDSTILMRYKMWGRGYGERLLEMVSAVDCSTESGVVESNSATGRDAHPLRIAPNPSAGHATIRYSVPVAGVISLELCDITGTLVTTLAGGYHDAGHYRRTLAAGGGEKALGRGVYFLNFETMDHRRTEKLVIR